MLTTLTRASGTNEEALRPQFESLMRDTYKQAHGLAFRLCGNASEAEDLVQEAYVRAFRFFHRYDRSLPFNSWLYRILTNLHIDGVRRRGRLRTTSLDHRQDEFGGTWDVPDHAAGPDAALMDSALDEPIQLGLRAMTPEFRIAVLLSDVEGMAYEEIAEVMNCSIGTVRSRIHRGRKQLRTYLQKRWPGRYELAEDEVTT
jgi:RNA polymerase sigma-70 factor (ECF subfamily)